MQLASGFLSGILQSDLQGRTKIRPVVVCRLQHMVRIQTACTFRQSFIFHFWTDYGWRRVRPTSRCRRGVLRAGTS